MTLGQKLFGSVGALLAIALLTGGLAVRNVSRLGSDVERIGHVNSRNLYLTGDVNALTTGVLSLERGMLVSYHLQQPEKARASFDKAMGLLDRLKQENGEFVGKTLSAELREKAQSQIQDEVEPLRQLITGTYELGSKGNLAGADAQFNDKVLSVLTAWTSHAGEVTQAESAFVTLKADESAAEAGPARNISLAMMALALLVGVVVIWIVREITATLAGSIAELRDGADQAAHAAAQISSSSQSLAQAASEQAASLEETSASAEEINSMARRNTDNSRSTATLLGQSEQKVHEANRFLGEMIVSMDQINESSGKISKIIKVIDEIAFQTNILALNAAVEAARAGEAGMGFAVVADEVRSLAQRSAQAAKDTATLIEDSIQKSGEGKSKVDRVALAIQAVTADSTRVKVMVDEVSLGSEEQSKGIEQIGRSISQMEQVTQTTAASAEESGAAAEQLSAQSEALKDVVSRLHAMVGGGGDSHSSHRPSVVQVARKPVASSSSRRVAVYKQANSAMQPRNDHGSGPQARAKTSGADEFPMEENFRSF